VPAAIAKENENLDESSTLVGSYLSGRFARSQYETSNAAAFYRSALSHDPGNEVLLEQAFQMEATSGNWPRAVKLAEELSKKQPNHRMAQIFLGIASFKSGDFDKADTHFQAAGEGPIGELTGTLARAWVEQARGKTQAALTLLDSPKQAEWAQFYLRYHRALIADVAGRKDEADKAYARVFKQDSKTLRTALAYAQHAAKWGDSKLARTILRNQLDKAKGGEGHPLAKALYSEIQKGDKIDIIIKTPSEGLAEVFYGLGEALTGEGGVSIGVLYLQMALYLEPEQPFALAALANAYEAAKQYDDAIATYDRIPKGSPLQSAIDIRKAFNLNSLDKVEEAKDILERVARDNPDDIKPLDALGNIMRSRKRYQEGVEYFTRAIKLIGKPDKRHWGFYYARGTCYERLKKWPQAEADLQKALRLSPEQPMTLNYLGYSWIDQGRNLKKGLAMIEKAVTLKPDDGYIVDSLGWAHFRMGNFKEAVRYLERAVELKPDDPVLNDHFGDALWRVGREREARFQWQQALTLEPEPEDATKIQKKLQQGLPVRSQAGLVRKAKEARRGDHQTRPRREAKTLE
jgi:tetratricopeptide (TPR) repeat protein